jgi:hypothetical protein
VKAAADLVRLAGASVLLIEDNELNQQGRLGARCRRVDLLAPVPECGQGQGLKAVARPLAPETAIHSESVS